MKHLLAWLLAVVLLISPLAHGQTITPQIGGGIGYGFDGGIQAPSGPNLANFLLYDSFAGAPGAAFNGRIPLKGPTWQASGDGGPNATAGAGVLKKNDGTVLYGFSQFGVVPQRYSCKWNYPSGGVNFPATYAIAQGNSNASNLLHGEMGVSNFFIRLGLAPTPTFTTPAWYVFGSNWSLTSGVEYQSELDYDGGTNASMILRNATTGAVIGSETVHDPQMASYAGVWTFAEALDNVLQYNNCFAQATTSYPFPTLNITYESAFPTNAAGFTGDANFGGTVTWNSAANITCSATAYPAGCGVANLGAVTIGDILWLEVDLISQTGGTAPNPNAWAIMDVVTPISAVQPFPTTTSGRIYLTATMTASSAAAHLLFTCPNSPGGIACTYNISQLNIYRNPPTNVPTPPPYP